MLESHTPNIIVSVSFNSWEDIRQFLFVYSNLYDVYVGEDEWLSTLPMESLIIFAYLVCESEGISYVSTI